MTATKVTDFESAQDALAASLPGYERRAPQGVLAHAIEDHLARMAPNDHLLGEAGTGTGKSLGYLIPAILSGKRVIISTATKALQDQIASKDLPFLKDHLGVPFTFAVLKGKSNYYCHVAGEKTALDNPPLLQIVNRTLDAQKDNETFLAEHDDFDGIEQRDWRTLTTSADDCPGRRKCPFGETCFSERAKAFAKDAQVVVVNHALLLTHLRIAEKTNGKVRILGDFDAVIFDEAHEIEEYATSAWQIDLRERGLINFASDVRSFAFKVGTDNPTVDRLSKLDGPITAAVQALWAALPEGRLLKSDVAEMGEPIINLYEQLVDCYSLLKEVDLSKVAAEDQKSRKGNHEKLIRRCDNLIEAISGLIARPEEFDQRVRWVDTETFGRRGVTNKVLHSAPIDVAPILRRNLFEQNRPCMSCDGIEGCKTCNFTRHEPNYTCLLVSATLSVANKFDYIAGRLGVDSYDGIDVGTPFDYPVQSRLYVPTHLPEPTQANKAAWSSMAINEMKTLLKASNGRALLLFTSVSQMRAAYDAISPGADHRCLMQGQGANKDLAATFMEDVHSILFATKSFFTGVDFQGEACSLVVIDKLVFDVPTDPIFAARCEAVDRAGGKSFFDYSIPKMALTLKQGFGRLIRHRNDSGVVAILDPRVETKGYGKTVLASLPNCPVIHTMDDVTQFFAAA